VSFPIPVLTRAQAALTRPVEVQDERGALRTVLIPCERALTVYLDKREIVTLMTLGAHPEWLVLGYLRNQRLVAQISDIESVTVDWEVGAAAVRTRSGTQDLDDRTRGRIVTTGCGQGSIFGAVMDDVERLQLPSASITHDQLFAIVDAIRLRQSTYKQAGSVHGCALFRGAEMLLFVEDVGRHNAIDTIAGWMWLQDAQAMQGRDKIFYTTGRLTSEMVIKSAQMGVPIVVSRSGMTEMGYAIASQLGLCAIGRATHRRFLCFSAPERLKLSL